MVYRRRVMQRMLVGMSLVEMIIAIFILFMGMEGMTILFLNSWKSNKFVLETGNASLIASRSVNQVVKDIRRARQADNGDYPVESGTDFDLKIYLDVDADGVTERIHYFLSDGSLYRGVTNPSATTPVSYPVGDEVVQEMAQYISNTPTDPLFSYYNRDYPADTINNPLATPIAVQDIRLIQVHLLVNIDPVHAPNNINVESFAELRNLNNY